MLHITDFGLGEDSVDHDSLNEASKKDFVETARAGDVSISDRAICGDLLWDVVVIYEAKAQEIIELSKYVRPIYCQ